ncbi:hypothetical protein ASPWEDRAFT_110519 [Aspergillus wentii DTO 134E9]|uniref:Uncharacterized protein n=1 Tax=Aspergillus wentii DTO 134E9 TaxID=1073089 RepID=A0A1L9RLM5_ASPWE|nr:uncharacterized protein ASPWEDRAFT_110519 [Aspergillus wentii DTO 134E9]KAI9929758.1 hypothetical protein MW887_001234 [Aspergillus wentii]OJJ35783.1 hypothetical protein ASPWEDRAFT_110519 [Aspergillus wentii DTO 134E9]
MSTCSEAGETCGRRYASDATLLLVGFFGAGKKTLGIIASVALRRRFIDFGAFFQQELHSLPQEYVAEHGLARYREVELELTRDLFMKCSKGCVIVGLGWMASRSQQMLLREFAREHPVVYVRRDKADLRQLLTTSQDKFDRIFDVGNTFFEACSNFDFFNRTQEATDPAYLKLKETERIFVRFLHHIFGRVHRPLASAEPFSASHTYALQVPVTWLEFSEDYEALETGADVINLILDLEVLPKDGLADRIARHMATIRKHARAPILVEVSVSPTDSRYHELLEMLLRLAPDALSCSLSAGDDFIQKLNAIKGHTKTMAITHQPTPLTGNCTSRGLSILQKTQDLGFEALRITGESKSLGDNLPCVSFLQSLTEVSTIPVIAYNTGPLGYNSVCLNPILSPAVLPYMESSGITVKQAQQAMTSCFLVTKRILFTIIGQNVTHTLSPPMHNAAYAACGLPYVHGVLKTEDISDFHRLLGDEKHGGLAVSLPYKTAVLPFLDEISPDAKDIHAINTVLVEQSQKNGATILKGYNTDYIGIKDGIEKNLSPANAIRDGTTALVVGAGGMAHAAIYACYQLGVHRICVYNRTLENAHKIAKYYNEWAESKHETNLHVFVLGSKEDPWPAQLRLPTIVIACIPTLQVGTELPVTFTLPEHWLQSKTGGVFVESAYGLPETPIMKMMRQRTSKGWVVVSGLTVLIEQGIAQYELFTKRPAPVHVMKRALEAAHLASASNMR